MRARVLLAALALLGSFAATGARAATDTTVVAQGNATLSYGSPVVNCAAPVVIDFVVQQSQAVYHEEWGPGSPGVEACAIGAAGTTAFASNTYPGFQQCTPVGGVYNPVYTLSQSGITYTLQSSVQLCNGTRVLDKIVVTVRQSNMTFTHTYSENGVVLVKGTGTIPRLA
ncbi:MAG: hypothetical protein ACRDJM_10340 [Actinomycetota bacterium]